MHLAKRRRRNPGVIGERRIELLAFRVMWTAHQFLQSSDLLVREARRRLFTFAFEDRRIEMAGLEIVDHGVLQPVFGVAGLEHGV